MVKRPRSTPRDTPPTPVLQIRRTRTPNNPPTDLVPGQLGIEMANDPPRLWVGVPTEIDPTARRELLAYGGIGGGWQGQVVSWGFKVDTGLGFGNRGILRVVRHRGGYIKHDGKLYLIPPEGFWWQQSPAP